MRVLRVVVVAALVLVFAVGMPVEADALLVSMTVDELAHEADTIVVAKVAAARSHNLGTSASRPAIATDYRLRVSRVLKGARPAEFSLTQPHGTVGDTTLYTPDLPELAPGEQAVLFLDAENRVIGGWQGKLAIRGGVVTALGIGVDELARRIDSGQSLEAAAVRASVDLLGSSLSLLSAPTITAVTPAGANGGIDETVTITGSGFGTLQGTVDFQAGDSLDLTKVVGATVVSWSDTAIVVTVPRKAASFVRVTTAAGAASANFAYQTGFSATGSRWMRLPAGYRINENAASMSGEGAAIQRAFTTWSEAGSLFRISYVGATARTGNAMDGENTISFAPLVSGALGTNYCWIQGTAVIESDIVFNADSNWASYGGPGLIDLETVALHELGHTVGLSDQYRDWSEVMSAYDGSEQRTLSRAEIDGAIYLYGSELSAEPPAPVVTSASHPDSSTWYSSRDVTWEWSTASSAVPIAGYRVIVDAAPDTVPTASAPATSGLSMVSAGLADGTWYLHIRAESSAGVLGPVTHAMVRVDGTCPVGSMTVGGGQAVVSDPLVSIDSAVTDARAGLDGMRISTDGGLTWSAWMAYAASRTVTLPAGDGPKSVHTQYRDRAGNVLTRTASVTLESVPAPATAVLDRWYGPNRYTTACEIARNAFSSADTVIIATGESFPDALSASGLAGAYDAPLLLTPGGSLPADVAQTIADLGARRAIIVGGTRAVSADVAQSLEALGGVEVSRIDGPDRYATAVAIADHMMATIGAPSGGTAFVVQGEKFADALAVAPVAYGQKMPVLLTRQATLPPSTADYLVRHGVRRCIVIGGTGAVSSAVATSLDSITPEPAERWFGADRYATAAEVASRATQLGWAQWSFVGVSAGTAFPDALGGGVAAGKAGGVLLMTRPESLPEPAAAALDARAASVRDCRVFGGSNAVSDDVYAAVSRTLAE